MLLRIVRMHTRRSQLSRYQLMSVTSLLYERLLLFVHRTLQTHHENLALVLIILHMFDYSPLCGQSNSSAISRLVLSYPYQTLMYRDVATLAQAHAFAVLFLFRSLRHNA